MKDSDRSKLDEILSRHDRRMADNTQREVNEAKAKEEFIRTFLERCMSVIRPAMMEIGDVLKSKGHDYKIVDNLTRKLDGNDVLKIDFQSSTTTTGTIPRPTFPISALPPIALRETSGSTRPPRTRHRPAPIAF